MTYSYISYNRIDVAYTAELNGGGLDYGSSFVPLFKEIFGKVNSLYEFCAGPGFIGFELLSEGFSERLYLSDVNPAATQCIKHTIEKNGLNKSAEFFLSEGLRDASDFLPIGKIDCVVANPPHFPNDLLYERTLIRTDEGWNLHREFLRDIKKYLSPTGSVLLLENFRSTGPETFDRLAQEAGMKMINVFIVPTENQRSLEKFIVWLKPLSENITVGAQTQALQSVNLNSTELKKELKGNLLTQLEVNNRLENKVQIFLYKDRPQYHITVPCSIAPGETSITTKFFATPGEYTIYCENRNEPIKKLIFK